MSDVCDDESRPWELKWFGPPPGPEWIEHVATPVGAICAHCGEPVERGDAGNWIVHMVGDGTSHRPYHRECILRLIVGSAAHIEKRCSCFGGSGCDGDGGLSRREAARQTLRAWTQ